VIFAGIVAAAGVAAGDALGPGVAPLLAVLALTLPASAAEGVAAAVLVRRFDTRALALRSIAAQAAAVITGIAIALHGGGAWSVVGQQLAFYAVSAALAFAMVPLRPGLPRLDLRPLVEMRGFAFASVLGAVVQRGGMRIFLLLVAAGAPPALAGLLQIAFRFTEMARDLPLSLVQRFALPALSQLRGDRAAFARWTEALLLLSGLLLATLLAGLAAVAAEMQVLLLGPAWVEVVGPVQVLAGALALCAARLPLPTVLAAAGHPGALLRHSVFGLTAMAAAVLILRPADATGAASLWVLSFAVPAVAGLVVASRRLGLRVLDQLQGWALSLLPAAAMLTVLAGVGAAGLMPIAALPALATKILLGAGVALAFAVPLGWPAWRVLLHRSSR
jgi:O-antigen/teichoic acid export membrane protein